MSAPGTPYDNALMELFFNNLKNEWILVGNAFKLIEFENISHINQTKIFFPNAKDIIPFALLKIKNKKLLFSKENSINYLYNKF